MRILFGPIVVGARGRFGGSVFSANASGAYMHPFLMPLRSHTEKQQLRRGSMSQQGDLWRALSAGQRTNWNNYAADPAQEKTNSLGESYYANGYNWFVALNMNLRLGGIAPNTDAPVLAVPSVPTVTGMSIVAPGDSASQVNIDVGSFGSNDAVFFLNVTRSSGNLSPVFRSFKFALFVANASLASTINLGDIRPLFGNVQVGQRWFLRAYAQNAEGRRSAFASFNVEAV